MKNPVLLLAATFTLAGPGYLIGAPLYWDLNGTAPGAGAAPAGTWDTATSNWNTDPDGIAGTPGLWTPGETAVFSAGTDAANPYTVTIAGTQSAGGIIQQDGTVTLSGGTLNLAASSILDVASSLTLSSIVSGGSAATRFTKLGAGNLVLSGANTFTGGFIISGGVVSHDGESSATAGTPSSSGALPAAAVADYFQLSNNAVLRNTRTGLGITALAANKGITLGTGGGTWDEPNFDSGNVHVYSGIITGTGQFTKSGAGVLALTAVQTYVGATNITGGVLRLRTNANLIPDGSAVNISPGAQFDVATFAETVGSIAGAGSVTGSATTTAIFTFGGDNTSTTFSGNISSTTGTATTRPVVKTGLGDLTIEGLEWANTGSVTINGGSIKYGNIAAGLNNSSQIILGAAGTLNMNGINDTVGSLSGAGSITNGKNLTLSGNNGTAAVFSGSYTTSVALAGTFTKNGAGTQRFTGSNGYLAATVNGGILEIGGSGGALPDVAAVTINGGTLVLSNAGGNGRISDLAAVSLDGTTTSTLRTTAAVTETFGALTLNGAGSKIIDFGADGAGSKLTFSGSVPITALNIWNWSGSAETINGFDQLLLTTGVPNTDYPSINFFSDSAGAVPVGSGARLLTNGSGFELVPIPEPGATLLAGLAWLAPLGWRRRRPAMR